jgi:hypothetical protein
VVPGSFVVTDLTEDGDVGNRGSDFRQVHTIATDKRYKTLDRWHPEIIQYDVTAGITNRRCQREIYKHVIESVIAVNENHAEMAFLSS